MVHAVHCHVVFCTRYRKPVLRGDIGQEVRGQIQRICRGHDVEILRGHGRPDQLQLFLAVPPHLSPNSLPIDGSCSLKCPQGQWCRWVIAHHRTLTDIGAPEAAIGRGARHDAGLWARPAGSYIVLLLLGCQAETACGQLRQAGCLGDECSGTALT